jgi:hypothetical protein
MIGRRQMATGSSQGAPDPRICPGAADSRTSLNVTVDSGGLAPTRRQPSHRTSRRLQPRSERTRGGAPGGMTVAYTPEGWEGRRATGASSCRHRDQSRRGDARSALGSSRATRSAPTWGRCGCYQDQVGGCASTRGASRPATRPTSERPGEPASWPGRSCPVSQRSGMTTRRKRTPSGAPLATSAQALCAAGDHQEFDRRSPRRVPCRSHFADAPESGVPERHRLPGHTRTEATINAVLAERTN